MPNGSTRPSRESEFAIQAEGRSTGFLGEFWYFLRHCKKWWLAPVILLLVLLSVLVVVGGSGAGPFIYTLF